MNDQRATTTYTMAANTHKLPRTMSEHECQSLNVCSSVRTSHNWANICSLQPITKLREQRTTKIYFDHLPIERKIIKEWTERVRSVCLLDNKTASQHTSLHIRFSISFEWNDDDDEYSSTSATTTEPFRIIWNGRWMIGSWTSWRVCVLVTALAYRTPEWGAQCAWTNDVCIHDSRCIHTAIALGCVCLCAFLFHYIINENWK